MSISSDQKPKPPASKLAGCFQAITLTLGMLALLFIVLLLIGIKLLQNMGPNPNVHTSLGAVSGSITALQNGQEIFAAIDHYHASVGDYPDTLLQLVPKSLPDRAILHSALDPVTDPNHVTWTYIKPKPNASPSTIVLRLNYVIPISSGAQGQVIPQEIEFAVDGTPTEH